MQRLREIRDQYRLLIPSHPLSSAAAAVAAAAIVQGELVAASQGGGRPEGGLLDDGRGAGVGGVGGEAHAIEVEVRANVADVPVLIDHHCCGH